MTPSNLLTEWARLLLATLRAAGVRDVVISPGARSTPFAWAALEEPALRCRSIIDERSAGFFAVGHARITGAPVLLICTSGSAAANYMPAVVEAAESCTPVLVLTADRGLDLQHAGAPQTIDQTKLYGGFVREHFELGTPDVHPRMLRAVQRLAAQAVLTARSPVPGPVHLNARARKPLEPDPGAGDDAAGLRAAVDALIARGPAAAHVPTAAPTLDAIEATARAVRGARRGLIVCGPALPRDAPAPAAVAALARATGFPVIAEPASQQRFARDIEPSCWIDGFATLIATAAFRDSAEPDLVLQLGRPPTASAWSGYLERWPGAERIVIAPHGWPDPWSGATAVIRSPIGAAIEALVPAVAALDPGDGGPAAPIARDSATWLARLVGANDTAWEVTDAAVREGFSEGAAVRAVVDALPDGGVLGVGNSLPIREVEMFVRAARRPITVWAQRGANGIDGLVSGAAGAAMAADRPTTLLVGDVSFAHDIGGLAAARGIGVPLAIVVLDNGGGRIFDRLPLADRVAGGRLDVWLTPPAIDLAAAAATFGIPHARAMELDSLDTALRMSATTIGPSVIEVVVPDGGTTEHQLRLLERLDETLRR